MTNEKGLEDSFRHSEFVIRHSFVIRHFAFVIPRTGGQGLMVGARVRLIVAAGLFALWMGWLAYLALTATNPLVLSRPQFLVADIWVVADLTGGEHPDDLITVDRIVWSSEDKRKIADGAKVSLRNLPLLGDGQDWNGPGQYILPLTRLEDGTFAVTPIPRSPGFPPRPHDEPSPRALQDPLRLRIYRVTPRTEQQIELLRQEQTTAANQQ
jgi:hypothetical protein